MKYKILDALRSGAVYVIGIGAIGLMLFWPQIVEGAGTFDLGGKFENSDLQLTTSIDSSWESGKWERDFEFDYRYKESKDIQTKNEGLIGLKQRLEFKPKHYAFGLVRYDFNEFREIKYRTQADIGWGYKILRTDKIKMSNEFAVGMLHKTSGSEIIIRNSLWFFYKVAPKLNFTNKFLYEATDVPLVRNETEFNYLLTDKVKIGLKNTYTEDPYHDNVLAFNVGYIF